jgi:hypothetical protein
MNVVSLLTGKPVLAIACSAFGQTPAAGPAHTFVSASSRGRVKLSKDLSVDHGARAARQVAFKDPWGRQGNILDLSA